MTLEYNEIFELFLGYVNDYDFVKFDLDDANELMTEWLKKAVSKPYVRRLFSSFSNDSEIMELSFEMAFEEDDVEYDLDFIRDVIAKGMVVEWLNPKVRSALNVNQFFGGKEQSFYAQQSHLNQLRALLDDVKVEQRKMIRDRGYINNDYLED